MQESQELIENLFHDRDSGISTAFECSGCNVETGVGFRRVRCIKPPEAQQRRVLPRRHFRENANQPERE